MKLIDIYESLIQESGYGNIKSLTEKYFNECMDRYFPEYKKYMSEWGIPVFKVRSGTATAGLFSYIPNKGKLSNQSITMNPDIAANGDDMVRRVTFHETIHYVQTNLSIRRLPPYENGKNTDHHDKYFNDMMGKINSEEGKDYVTVKQDSEGIQVSSKEIYVYGIETNRGDFASVWSPTQSEELEKWLMTTAKAKYKNVFYFKTNDYYFKDSKSKLKNGGNLRFVGINKPDKIQMCRDNFK